MAAIDNVNWLQHVSHGQNVAKCPNCGANSHASRAGLPQTGNNICVSCSMSEDTTPAQPIVPTSAPQVLKAGFLADFGKVGYKDARDIGHEYDHLETKDQSFEDYMREKKLSRSKEMGLHDSIRSEGVRTPVRLYIDSDRPDLNPTVVSGHHRIFSAADINPDMDVPVEYTQDWWETKPLPRNKQRTVHRDISGRQG